MSIQINGTSGISGVDGSATTPALQGTDTNTGLTFGTDTVNFVTGGTTRATVDANGDFSVNTDAIFVDASADRVGIGTTSPGAGLHLISAGQTTAALNTAGDINFLASDNGTSVGNGGSIVFGFNSGSGRFAAIKALAVTGGGNSIGDLAFSTRNATTDSTLTERMRINSTGDVTINGASTDAKLVVANGSERQVSFKINNTNISPVGMQIRYGVDVNAGANRFIDCIGNATTRFLVFANGNVQNTNNSYGAISDIKLKENVVDANSQWSDIKALQVRNYNLKENLEHRQIGLIAQEVELVSPGLVTESPDTDEDGNDLGTVTKSVNYSVLYMKAVKALQEAMERIEQLETRVAQLEGGAA